MVAKSSISSSLTKDGVEYEVPEDSALELIALMCMLDEEDDES